MKNKFLLFTFIILGLFVLASCKSKNKDNPGTNDNPGQDLPSQDDPGQDNPPVVDKKTYKITYYDGSELLAEQKYEKGQTIEFLVPVEKEGKFFAGWYEENDRLFELEIMPGFDIDLYAKYENGFTYTFVDYDGTVLKVGHGTEGSQIVAPANPTRERVGTTAYTFAGWDKAVGTLTENVTFTATYSEKQVAILTYAIDGGNFKYSSYDEVVSDILYDYNKFNNSSYSIGSLPDGAWDCANFASFFYSGSNKAKWGWLATYLSKVGNSSNKAALAALTPPRIFFPSLKSPLLLFNLS